MVCEPPPVPWQAVQLPPSAGATTGGPGADIGQLVGLDNLHDNSIILVGVVNSNQADNKLIRVGVVTNY